MAFESDFIGTIFKLLNFKRIQFLSETLMRFTLFYSSPQNLTKLQIQ